MLTEKKESNSKLRGAFWQDIRDIQSRFNKENRVFHRILLSINTQKNEETKKAILKNIAFSVDYIL